jgi:hypothetical protein
LRQRRVSETGETWGQALQRTARDANERQKAKRERWRRVQADGEKSSVQADVKYRTRHSIHTYYKRKI